VSVPGRSLRQPPPPGADRARVQAVDADGSEAVLALELRGFTGIPSVASLSRSESARIVFCSATCWARYSSTSSESVSGDGAGVSPRIGFRSMSSNAGVKDAVDAIYGAVLRRESDLIA